MLSRFALTIWRASGDAFSYVADFAKRTTGSGLGYLYALRVTLAFFGLLPFAIGIAILAPHAGTFARTQLAALREWYPDELVLTVSGGVLSTNVEEPYVLDLPATWRSGDEGEPVHAVTIDTSASADDFASYDTAVLLTKTSAVVRDRNGLRVFQLSELKENVTVDEALVAGVTESLGRHTPALPWIAGGVAALLLVLLPWIVGGVAWLFSLLFLCWATAILWVVSAGMGRGMRYGELFRLGLFGVTNSAFLSFALTMTGLGSLRWTTYVLFFGWMVYVISRFPRRVSAAKSPLPPAATKAPATPPSKKPAAKKKRAPSA
jgi:hypothetical protein